MRHLFRGQLDYLREAGFDITLVASPGEEVEEAARREQVELAAIPMEREIALGRDLVALWRMWRLMRRVRPTVSNVGTPKAGFVGGLAAWLNRVPCRIYTLHGLRLETTTGLKRWVLATAERIACRCAHRVVCASDSLRNRALELRLVNPERAMVLGSGSINGVEVSQFAPTPERLTRAAEIRRELGIPRDAPVLGYVGRLTRDKGVPELVQAFNLLRRGFPDLRLLVVGPFEKGDAVPEAIREFIETDDAVAYAGYVADPHLHYHVMDVLALPSHREGFGAAILEASAAGKPVVAARATGIIDAVLDGVTGILVPVGDAPALAAAAARLLANRELAEQMGRAGRVRAEREFASQRIWAELAALYCDLLEQRGLPAPAREFRLPDMLPVAPGPAPEFVAPIEGAVGAVYGRVIGVLGLPLELSAGDPRDFHAAALTRALLDAGAGVQAYDPVAMAASWELPPGLRLCATPYEAAEGAHCLAIAAENHGFADLDWQRVRKAMATPVIFDTRNQLDPQAVREAGFEYYGVGAAASLADVAVRQVPGEI